MNNLGFKIMQVVKTHGKVRNLWPVLRFLLEIEAAQSHSRDEVTEIKAAQSAIEDHLTLKSLTS